MFKIKIVLILLSSIIYHSGIAQTPNPTEYPLDTLNGIVFGSYPKINNSLYKGLADSILEVFPNRTKIDFKNISSTSRDSLVSVYWRKFRTDFNNSVDFGSLKNFVFVRILMSTLQ